MHDANFIKIRPSAALSVQLQKKAVINCRPSGHIPYIRGDCTPTTAIWMGKTAKYTEKNRTSNVKVLNKNKPCSLINRARSKTSYI